MICPDLGVKSTRESEIKAPVEKVFSSIINVNRWPEWNGSVMSASLTSAFKPGSVFRWRAARASIRSTILEMEYATRIVWSGKAFGVKALHSWEFEKRGENTRVRTTECFYGWLTRLLPKQLKKTLDESLETWLSDLCIEAESH